MSSRGRVLVVDDEKLIRWSVGERLTRQGFEVQSAETGEAAVELVAAKRPAVMLLDVRLPGIDGVETLRQALGAHPELVVVMMSAHSSVDTAVEAMKDGAVDFLVKPFPLAQLDAAVERAFATVAARSQLTAPAPPGDGGMVGRSPALQRLQALLARLEASSETTVLVVGESGSGKELVARSIHETSARAKGPFLHLNCAALPEPLLESELFGHERGAFTDAHALKRGLFEQAQGGTVMLDEIGDLPPGGQAKLLRLLENKTFRRVGGSQELSADGRVIAATNVDLEQRVKQGRFRADLYFRLNVICVQVPPLRERREDIPLLAAHFLGLYAQQLGRKPPLISPQALTRLMDHQWPGNVRELRNVMERSLVLHAVGTELRPEHLPPQLVAPAEADDAAPIPSPPRPPEAEVPLTLLENEKKLIVDTLEKAHGNQSKAARLLGISRDTLRYRMRKHALL